MGGALGRWAQRRRGSAPQALGVSSPWGLGHGAEREGGGPAWGQPCRGSQPGALGPRPGSRGFLTKLH